MTEIEKHILALKSANKNVYERAIEALVQIGTDAVPALIDALKDEDSYFRRMVIEALGKIGDASALPALIDALKEEDRFFVGGSVASALGRISGWISGSLEPTDILASERLKPNEKYQLLDALSKLKYHEDGLSLRYVIGGVERYCKKICQDKTLDAKVIKGAEDVLNFRHLLRQSSASGVASEILLRPAAFNPEDNRLDDLLIPGEAPTQTPTEPPRKGFFARLLGL